MLDTLVTHLQIFGIGFSFGLIGPCFLTCTPILITYVVGAGKRWGGAAVDIFIFLAGRLIAYLVLGTLAGLSAAILRQFIGSRFGVFSRPMAGAIAILLGISILFFKPRDAVSCKTGPSKIYNAGGLFVLGFAVGISPCAPLLALLSEIALMSRTALEGASYGLSFGLGTFLASFIIVGALSGVLVLVPAKTLKSKGSIFVFRTVCAALLILLGLGLIIGSLKL